MLLLLPAAACYLLLLLLLLLLQGAPYQGADGCCQPGSCPAQAACTRNTGDSNQDARCVCVVFVVDISVVGGSGKAWPQAWLYCWDVC